MGSPRWSKLLWLVWSALVAVGLGLALVGVVVVRGIPGGILVMLGLFCAGLVVAAVIRLRQIDPSGWVISWDIPEALQFSAYIGQQEAFSFVETDAPHSEAEREWQVWWRGLPDRLFTYHADMDHLFRSRAHLSPAELWRQIGPPDSFDYEPPDFDGLSEQPALQALCRRHWPDFQRRWEIEKPEFIAKMREQGGTVREERIVRSCVRAADKTMSAPFFLRLDFVRWPEAYRRQHSLQHIVLGVQHLEATSVEQLRAIITAAVAKLV
jgi:hypothetical protein